MTTVGILLGLVGALALACGALTAMIRSLYECTWREAALITGTLLLAVGILTGLNLIGGAS